MRSLIPKALKKGDIIGFVAASERLDEIQKKKFEGAIKVITGFGLKYKLGKYLFSSDRYGYAAATPQERGDDINEMFADQNVQAIWCCHGGYTANSVLDFLDYELIKKNPKVFIGLSNATMLLDGINKMTGLVTFHGPPPKVEVNESFSYPYTQNEFKKVFLENHFSEIAPISDWRNVRGGKAKGKIMGGNLTCIEDLIGTKYFPDFSGAILLLEDYKIDIPQTYDKLTHLKQAGVFDQIAGVVVGYIWGFQKEYNKVAQFEDILLDITDKYSFPVLKINEFGHKKQNTFLPIGGTAELDADKKVFKTVGKYLVD